MRNPMVPTSSFWMDMGKERVGYIKLHRKILDNEIWEGESILCKPAALIEVFLHVSFRDHTMKIGSRTLIERRGEWVVSERQLAKRWGWSRHKVRDFLTFLEDRGMIHLDKDLTKDHLPMKITVINWDTYQACDREEEPIEEPIEGPIEDLSRTIPKKGKKGKNAKPKYIYDPTFEIFWERYPNKRSGKQAAYLSWEKALKNYPEISGVEIIASVKKHKELSPEWLRGFVPHATTWLNQARWTAEFEGEDDDF